MPTLPSRSRPVKATHALMAEAPLDMLGLSQRLHDLRVKLRLLNLDAVPGALDAARRVGKLRRLMAFTAVRLSEALWQAEEEQAHLYRPEGARRLRTRHGSRRADKPA